MLYNTQNNPKWKNYNYDKSNKNATIGRWGCYGTAISNIVGITPLEFFKKTEGCYNEGYIIHEKAGKKANYERTKGLTKLDIDGDNYILYWWYEYQKDKYYKHFSNIINVDKNNIQVFNVLTGLEQWINKDIIDIIRIKKL